MHSVHFCSVIMNQHLHLIRKPSIHTHFCSNFVDDVVHVSALIVFVHIARDCMIRTVPRQVPFHYPVETLVGSIPTFFPFTTERLLLRIQFTRIDEIFLLCVRMLQFSFQNNRPFTIVHYKFGLISVLTHGAI